MGMNLPIQPKPGSLGRAVPPSQLPRGVEYKEWAKQHPEADVIVRDSRAKEIILEGSISNWMHNDAFLFLDVDTGYEVRIGMKSLMRVIDKLVSEEVLNRLKGEDKK